VGVNTLRTCGPQLVRGERKPGGSNPPSPIMAEDTKFDPSRMKSKVDFSWMKPRDPNRIPIILDYVREIWNKYPDARLFQLLMNAAKKYGDPYHVEDDELLKGLEAYLSHIQNTMRDRLLSNNAIKTVTIEPKSNEIKLDGGVNIGNISA
jgi:hypothetical protein